jgi:uncharacterized protein YjiS (DUF1127 family)
MNTDLQKHTPASLSSLRPDIDYHRFSRRAARLRSQAFTSGWRRFGDLLMQGLQAWSERRREKRAVTDLKRLTRQELRDLGLYPGDLDRLQQGGLTTAEIAVEIPLVKSSANQPNLRLIAGKTVLPDSATSDQDLRKCG